jgi:hypothetical protein
MHLCGVILLYNLLLLLVELLSAKVLTSGTTGIQKPNSYLEAASMYIIHILIYI